LKPAQRGLSEWAITSLNRTNVELKLVLPHFGFEAGRVDLLPEKRCSNNESSLVN
jgi:hypothetical protein